MPCTGGGPPSDYEDKQEINKLTKMLCRMCKIVQHLDDGEVLIKTVKGLKPWWDAHKKEDRRRVKKQREARKKEQKMEDSIKKAKSKLTAQEYEDLVDSIEDGR